MCLVTPKRGCLSNFHWILEDRAPLVALLQARFGRKHGWQRDVAKATGLKPDRVSRLVHGKGRARLRPATVEALAHGLPERRQELAALFLAPESRARLADYEGWLDQEGDYLRGLNSPRRPLLAVSGRTVAMEVRWETGGGDDSPPRAVHVRDAIRRLKVYDSIFDGFRKRARQRWGRSEGDARADLAELRAVAPLAAAGHTGGVERSAWELHAARELGAYLRAALSAQEKLLRRVPAQERARLGLSVPTRAAPLGRPPDR